MGASSGRCMGLRVAAPVLGFPAALTLGFGRDAVPGGDAAGHPSTPRRAGHPGVPPVPREQDIIR